MASIISLFMYLIDWLDSAAPLQLCIKDILDSLREITLIMPSMLFHIILH